MLNVPDLLRAQRIDLRERLRPTSMRCSVRWLATSKSVSAGGCSPSTLPLSVTTSSSSSASVMRVRSTCSVIDGAGCASTRRRRDATTEREAQREHAPPAASLASLFARARRGVGRSWRRAESNGSPVLERLLVGERETCARRRGRADSRDSGRGCRARLAVDSPGPCPPLNRLSDPLVRPCRRDPCGSFGRSCGSPDPAGRPSVVAESPPPPEGWSRRSR